MLQAEGFVIDNLIDIFDGGPVVRCRRDEIDAVKRTMTTHVESIVHRQDGDPQILASTGDGFRAMIGPVHCGDSGATISEVEALTLQVKVGDPLRILSLHP
jgi:arginine N-succinyltransferase